MSGASVWCFYTVQNDQGDSSATPNAFRVRYAGSAPLLSDVKKAFPLRGTGSFHFRFSVRVKSKSGTTPMFLDCVRDDDAVPLTGSNLQARILRLDNLTCVSRRSIALEARPLATAALPATRASSSGEARARASTPSSGAGAEDPDLFGASHAGAKHPPANEFEGMPPLSRDELDEDLRGKEIVVASLIQRRRNKDRDAEQAQVDRVRGDDARRTAAAAERWKIKEEIRPQLDEWAREPGGGLRDVRVLLVKLQDVLWEGAKWKPVTMGTVMADSKVKLFVRKAQLVVHPDKLPSLGPREQYIAEVVFNTLQEAYQKFEAGRT